jgi:hypothetical protein
MAKETVKVNTGERKFEVYKLAFEHADKEWDMLWQRNGTFLVANSAFLFTVGLLQSNAVFAFTVSMLGLLLALIWLHSNREAYGWNMYWIRELRNLESELDGCKLWTETASRRAKERGRPSTRLGFHGTYISLVFALAWFGLTVFFLLGVFKIV